MKKSINSFIAMIMVAISANAQMKVSNTGTVSNLFFPVLLY